MAKIVAWLLCIVSVMGTMGLGFCLVVGMSEDLWEKTREEALESAYRIANMSYSSDAFYNRGNPAYAEKLRGEFFRYGIIQSDRLDGVDFRDRRSYLDTNMTEQELAGISPDELFLELFVMTEKGSVSRDVMGYFGEYEDIALLSVMSDSLLQDSGWTYLYADRICYDVAKGIVYYRARRTYYPVQNVAMCYDGSHGKMVYNYQYDFANQGYRLIGQSPDTSMFDQYTDGYAADGRRLWRNRFRRQRIRRYSCRRDKCRRHRLGGLAGRTRLSGFLAVKAKGALSIWRS